MLLNVCLCLLLEICISMIHFAWLFGVICFALCLLHTSIPQQSFLETTASTFSAALAVASLELMLIEGKRPLSVFYHKVLRRIDVSMVSWWCWCCWCCEKGWR